MCGGTSRPRPVPWLHWVTVFKFCNPVTAAWPSPKNHRRLYSRRIPVNHHQYQAALGHNIQQVLQGSTLSGNTGGFVVTLRKQTALLHMQQLSQTYAAYLVTHGIGPKGTAGTAYILYILDSYESSYTADAHLFPAC